jgi:hypothetical protein
MTAHCEPQAALDRRRFGASGTRRQMAAGRSGFSAVTVSPRMTSGPFGGSSSSGSQTPSRVRCAQADSALGGRSLPPPVTSPRADRSCCVREDLRADMRATLSLAKPPPMKLSDSA